MYLPSNLMRPETASSSSASAERLDWIDTARGTAITLVVAGHCLRGLHSAGLISDPAAYQRADSLIYMFHMHVFFVLSGMFLLRQAARCEPARMAGHLARRLLVPLALWTYIFLGLKALAGASVNAPGGFDSLLRLPLPPVAHLWFLWALFLGMLALGLTLARVPGLRHLPAAWFAAAAAALLFWASMPLTPGLRPWLGEFLRYLPFLALGAGLSLFPRWVSGPALPLPVSLLVFAAAAAIHLRFENSLVMSALLSGTAALAFLQAVKWLASQPRMAAVQAPLQQLGRYSMAVFLAHTVFSAPMRIVLTSFGVTATAPHFAAGMAAGLIGPVLMVALLRKLRLTGALGL